MSFDMKNLSRLPTPDDAEDNAFFPSPYALARWKVLISATEERYVLLENGKMFSTGNHPVEMLLPVHHLMEAGFDVDVATITGYPAKLEMWAMPSEDKTVLATYEA